jgi:hypothetical protein
MTHPRLLVCTILFAACIIALTACGQSGGELPTPASLSAKPFVVPPDAVSIKPLPPLLTLHGDEVPFEGRTEIVQRLAGNAATEIVVVAFHAAGENANRSEIRIVWEDGGVETIPPGAKNLVLAPQRRARQIIVRGYSFHERRVFKDAAKKGTLSWVIRYAPAE